MNLLKTYFLENNYVTCDFLEIPNSFENLTPFKSGLSSDEIFKTLEDRMNRFSSWVLTHSDFRHSEVYKYYLKIKTYNI